MRKVFWLSLLFLLVLTSFSFACIPNWIRNDTSCYVNDTKQIWYYDTNDCNSTNYPYNYGDIVSCDYCYPNLDQIFGDCINGTQEISWVDYDYYSCCAVTGLESDCYIDEDPFNTTTTQTCYWNNLTTELGNLSCQIQPNMGIKDKEYCIAHIPLEYSNESFKCIAIIRNGYTNEIIQTTPEYRETSQTFINLNPEADTREYFSPANTIVNFYYTGKNLNPDNDYILSILCSSEERSLTSEMRFSMGYEDVSFVFFRVKWLMANAPYVIAGIIVAFILILIGIWIIKGVK